VLTYYITDRTQFAGGEAERRSKLLQTIRQSAAAGVDYIQLREKDLAVRELESLAREALRSIRGEGQARLLINHRTDVALAVAADGVHLTGDDIPAGDARALAAGRQAGRDFLVAVSCHSAKEVRLAEAHGADFVVLAPIFEKFGAEKAHAKRGGPAKIGSPKATAAGEKIGLEELRLATRQEGASDARIEAGSFRSRFPVFALGGVDRERAALCAAAGAAGIAGIRIFQQCSDLPELVRALHSL
jgi:thiamine-phosphate pyrophosphorylase